MCYLCQIKSIILQENGRSCATYYTGTEVVDFILYRHMLNWQCAKVTKLSWQRFLCDFSKMHLT